MATICAVVQLPASPLLCMDEVIRHANGGGLVMGICNGFQILTESGLLPGALLHNVSQKFVCKNSWIRPVSPITPLTANLDANKAYKVPVAHGEGRYFTDQQGLEELQANDQILFRYCDKNGE